MIVNIVLLANLHVKMSLGQNICYISVSVVFEAL